ncbi:hypothetical protein CEXT_230421 [Caerostris extrusa]|uniref:Secreted protein n=1 Tax=Caerostris extrusa TaxID=172846 RepID=A0AAV4U9L5_CAEEX|nr:hypothetical protein CEXT_230421 [Caerostris extrusa]
MKKTICLYIIASSLLNFHFIARVIFRLFSLSRLVAKVYRQVGAGGRPRAKRHWFRIGAPRRTMSCADVMYQPYSPYFPYHQRSQAAQHPPTLTAQGDRRLQGE